MSARLVLVSSGPTLPPSPKSLWQTAQCLTKSSFPRAASPAPARRSFEKRRTSASFSSGVPGFTLPQCLCTAASMSLSPRSASSRTCSTGTSAGTTLPDSMNARNALAHSLRLKSTSRARGLSAAGRVG